MQLKWNYASLSFEGRVSSRSSSWENSRIDWGELVYVSTEHVNLDAHVLYPAPDTQPILFN